MTIRAKEQRGILTRQIERRAYPVKVQVKRAAAGSTGPAAVEGYASVVETPYEMYDWYGPYSEVVRSGAFAKTLSENPQVQLLLNHGGLSMAYTQAGTLALSEDSTGLHLRADVNPARGDVNDMLIALEDGAVDEMSFAFRVTRQLWSPDYDQRDIIETDIHRGDVSVVNFGANPATSVDATRAARLALRSQLRALAGRVQVRALSTADTQALTALLMQISEADGVFHPFHEVIHAADSAIEATEMTLSALLGLPAGETSDNEDMGAGMPASLAAAQIAVLRARVA